MTVAPMIFHFLARPQRIKIQELAASDPYTISIKIDLSYILLQFIYQIKIQTSREINVPNGIVNVISKKFTGSQMVLFMILSNGRDHSV